MPEKNRRSAFSRKVLLASIKPPNPYAKADATRARA
jgi:hypothetical protein